MTASSMTIFQHIYMCCGDLKIFTSIFSILFLFRLSELKNTKAIEYVQNHTRDIADCSDLAQGRTQRSKIFSPHGSELVFMLLNPMTSQMTRDRRAVMAKKSGYLFRTLAAFYIVCFLCGCLDCVG